MPSVIVQDWGRVSYDVCYTKMQESVAQLSSEKPPQNNVYLWIVQHDPVYTAGFSTSPAYFGQLRAPHDRIPFVFVDRGGQVTYHGPGQLILYFFVPVRLFFQSSPRLFVHFVEESLLVALAGLGIQAHRRLGIPGIYVSDAKLVSLGFKFHCGWSYHGVAINVDMDLSPFSSICPCGLSFPMTQIRNLAPNLDYSVVSQKIVGTLSDCFAALP